MALTDTRIEEQDLSSGDLRLEARDGEGLHIAARGVSGGANGSVVEEYVREELMMAYPAHGGDDELVPEADVRESQHDLFTVMRNMDYRAPMLHVPEGHEFILSNPDGSGTATVVYRQVDPGAVRPAYPGGPDTKTRTSISTAQDTLNLAAGASGTLDVETSRNPSQMHDFPFGVDVPANFEYDLQALAVELDGTSGGNVSLDGLRLTTEEIEFLARDSEFVSPAFADYPDLPLDVYPLMFDDPLTFTAGQELDLTVQVSNSGGAAEDAVVNATAIMYRRAV